MIGIIDYGRGNISSVETALTKGGFENVTTDDLSVLDQCDGLILPGVGAFRDGMNDLERRGLIPFIRKAVAEGKPLLGICLGLHLLFEVGEEDGETEGLGIMKGRVERLTTSYKIPHIGWNELKIRRQSPLLEGIKDGDTFYFVHSYQAHPVDESVINATCDYGQEVVAVVSRDNVFGVQFHPEKSSAKGLQLIQNFGRLVQKWS
mgnify:CR=1 FL=1